MYLCLSAYNSSVCPVCQSVHRSVYPSICVSQFICLSVNWYVRFVYVTTVYHLYVTTWLTVSYMSPLSIICILLPGWQFRICRRCLSSVCYYLVVSFVYRVFQNSVPEPSSLGAAKYSEVSIYSKVAAKVVYLSIESHNNFHIMF